MKISKDMNDAGRNSETHFFDENKGVAEIEQFHFNSFEVCLDDRLPFYNLTLLSLLLILQHHTNYAVPYDCVSPLACCMGELFWSAYCF